MLPGCEPRILDSRSRQCHAIQWLFRICKPEAPQSIQLNRPVWSYIRASWLYLRGKPDRIQRLHRILRRTILSFLPRRYPTAFPQQANERCSGLVLDERYIWVPRQRNCKSLHHRFCHYFLLPVLSAR